MTDHNTDEIRDLLAREMSDAPEPHAWADVEQRARQHDAPPPERRRSVAWLAAAACTIALMGGLVAVVGSDDEPGDEPVSTTPSTPTTTTASAPTTISSEGEAGWSGGLLDDLDTASLRPLDSYVESDVIIPTGPTGWRVEDAGWRGDDPNTADWQVDVTEARPENNWLGQHLYVRMSRTPTCSSTLGCQPSGRSVTINGVVWEEIVVERIPEDDPDFFDMTTLRAQVGDRWVSLAAGAPQALAGPLLDNPPIIEFLEGLRAGPPGVLASIGEACWQCGVAGAEGDPFAVVDSSATPPSTMSDGGPTATSPPQAPSEVGSGTGRALTDLAPGDVVVPTYIPPGLTLQGEAQIYEHGNGMSEFSFSLKTTDGLWANSVRLWDNGSSPIGPATGDDPNHPPVEIAGLTWEWNDFESARIAHIGSFSMWVYLHGLDRSEAQQFIEGLRAASIEQFPGPVVSDGADGLSVIDPNDSGDAEVVASDDQFELTAVQVGDQVCTKLEQTTVPATMTFAANCWETTRLTELGIVDLYPLDATDTKHLIIGVIDSPNTTAVRVTSPEGASAVVPTGPGNRAIDGRFFLARLDLDASSEIFLDRFTIEDASP